MPREVHFLNMQSDEANESRFAQERKTGPAKFVSVCAIVEEDLLTATRRVESSQLGLSHYLTEKGQDSPDLGTAQICFAHTHFLFVVMHCRFDLPTQRY